MYFCSIGRAHCNDSQTANQLRELKLPSLGEFLCCILSDDERGGGSKVAEPIELLRGHARSAITTIGDGQCLPNLVNVAPHQIDNSGGRCLIQPHMIIFSPCSIGDTSLF
jgi:hypothetical protein